MSKPDLEPALREVTSRLLPCSPAFQGEQSQEQRGPARCRGWHWLRGTREPQQSSGLAQTQHPALSPSQLHHPQAPETLGSAAPSPHGTFNTNSGCAGGKAKNRGQPWTPRVAGSGVSLSLVTLLLSQRPHWPLLWLLDAPRTCRSYTIMHCYSSCL